MTIRTSRSCRLGRFPPRNQTVESVYMCVSSLIKTFQRNLQLEMHYWLFYLKHHPVVQNRSKQPERGANNHDKRRKSSPRTTLCFRARRTRRGTLAACLTLKYSSRADKHGQQCEWWSRWSECSPSLSTSPVAVSWTKVGNNYWAYFDCFWFINCSPRVDSKGRKWKLKQNF